MDDDDDDDGDDDEMMMAMMAETKATIYVALQHRSSHLVLSHKTRPIPKAQSNNAKNGKFGVLCRSWRVVCRACGHALSNFKILG